MTSMTQDNKLESLKPAYNPERLALLAKECIGPHSLKEYSAMSGLSLSYLSRLTNARLLSQPSRRTIYRLAMPVYGVRAGKIRFSELLEAAGYEPVDDAELMDGTKKEESRADDAAVPAIAWSPMYPLCIFLNGLVARGDWGTKINVSIQAGLYEISGNGRAIAAIPAFCKDSEVELKIKNVGLSLIMAFSVLNAEEKDYYILTDSRRLYEEFEDRFPTLPDINVYVALTEDYIEYTRQRKVAAYGDRQQPDIKEPQK